MIQSNLPLTRTEQVKVLLADLKSVEGEYLRRLKKICADGIDEILAFKQVTLSDKVKDDIAEIMAVKCYDALNADFTPPNDDEQEIPF